MELVQNVKSRKRLLGALQKHVQSITADKNEQDNDDTRKKINGQCKINKELQDKLNQEKVEYEQLNKKRRIYKKIMTDSKQEYINDLVENKNKFEEVLTDNHYLQLKLELKESMKQELEVYIDEETKKHKMEEELIVTIEREYEIQKATMNNMLQTMRELKQQNESLENELENGLLILDKSKKLQLEHQIKFTLAEKFNKNVLDNRNNLINIENQYIREIMSLKEIQKKNEIINKRLIKIILDNNLMVLTNEVNVLLHELDKCYAKYYELKSNEKNISGQNNGEHKNKKSQQRYSHNNHETFKIIEKPKRQRMSTGNNQVLLQSNTQTHSNMYHNRHKVESFEVTRDFKDSHLLEDLINHNNTGGGDYNNISLKNDWSVENHMINIGEDEVYTRNEDAICIPVGEKVSIIREGKMIEESITFLGESVTKCHRKGSRSQSGHQRSIDSKKEIGETIVSSHRIIMEDLSNNAKDKLIFTSERNGNKNLVKYQSKKNIEAGKKYTEQKKYKSIFHKEA